MKLPKEIESLLLQSGKIGKFVPDEYDIELSDIIKEWREVDSADVGLVGIPFDTSVLIRRGCRFGPGAVRNALVFATSYEPGLDVDLSTNFEIVDFGNIDVVHTDVLKTHERIEKVITAIYKTGVIPVVIGGDHVAATNTVVRGGVCRHGRGDDTEGELVAVGPVGVAAADGEPVVRSHL